MLQIIRRPSKNNMLFVLSKKYNTNSIEINIKKTISRDLGEKPFHIEGNNIGEWVLMDYSDIIVHVFQEKTRAFYNIEDFWGDAKFKNYKSEE